MIHRHKTDKENLTVLKAGLSDRALRRHLVLSTRDPGAKSLYPYRKKNSLLSVLKWSPGIPGNCIIKWIVTK